MPRFIADSSLSASIKVAYTNSDGECEDLFDADLIELGLTCSTTFSHAYRREFERLRQEAEERGAGLWGTCHDGCPTHYGLSMSRVRSSSGSRTSTGKGIVGSVRSLYATYWWDGRTSDSVLYATPHPGLQVRSRR